MPLSDSRRAAGIGGNPSCSETGTAVAIYNSSKSARPFDAKPCLSGWGGARNRADRVSHEVTLRQATGIINAAHTACQIGLPFNRHLTIHLERAGVPDTKAAAAIGQFLTLARDWLRKQALTFAYVWVRENGDGKGSHVHILLHVPAGATWTGWRLRRWLVHVTGVPYSAGAIRTERIGGTVRAALVVPEHYRANLMAVVSYVLKGASSNTVAALGLSTAREPGGAIIGKRAGWSQNVRRAAWIGG